MADFYDLLGVSRDADADTLKRSYRRLARQYHPDIKNFVVAGFIPIAAADFSGSII